MKVLPCTEESLSTAAGILTRGGVVVIPTDTVYGLAAHPDFPEAVERLYTIKGREAKKPVAMLASSADDVVRFGVKFPQTARNLAGRYWPGALTLVLATTENEDVYEGFRVPAHSFTRRLLRMCGGVLRVTSANVSGGQPATDVPAALEDVGLDADLILDDGVSPGGVASTVVKVSADNAMQILRRGGIEISV